MIIYILMLVTALGISVVAQKTENKKKHTLLAILSAIPFAIVSSIRYDVGTDYLFRYASDYNILAKGGYVNNLEIGFKLLNRLCILITENYQIIFVITSLVITAFIFYTIYRDSRNIPLSIALYFIGAFFFQSLNMVRQYIAISVILCSYKCFLDKEWIKWGLFILIASLFHTTSLIIGAIWIAAFIINKKIKKEIFTNWKLVLSMVLVLFLGEPLIRGGIQFLLMQTKYKVYVGSKFDHGDLQIIPFAINLLLYIGMAYIAKTKKEELSNIDKFFMTMQAISLIFVVLGKTTFLSLRLVYYFSIFQIISIPHFLKYVKELWNEKIYKIAMTAVIVMFSITLLWTHVLHTSDEILPYKTIFNKQYEFK